MRNTVLLICLFGVANLTSHVGYGEEKQIGVQESSEHQATSAVAIPLDRIWSLGMVGTKNIRELEKEPVIGEGAVDKLLKSIIESSEVTLRNRQAAKPGFAVAGDGALALRNARKVFVDGENSSDSFPVGTELTIVFFSYLASDVQVTKVELRDTTVNIDFRFVKYMERNLSMQLALIPLGKLSAGNYEVRMTQKPAVLRLDKNTYQDIKPLQILPEEKILVSRSFSFKVSESPQ